MQEATDAYPRLALSPEEHLSQRDPVLRSLIAMTPERWSPRRPPSPIWQLAKLVIAQQISTAVATKIADRVVRKFPSLLTSSTPNGMTADALTSCGLTARKAECCITIVLKARYLEARVQAGQDVSEDLAAIKGIGPWTIAMFRIFVLRELDILPTGDSGLERAFRRLYGSKSLVKASDKWKPYRSVACWYLWRSLGNPPLG